MSLSASQVAEQDISALSWVVALANLALAHIKVGDTPSAKEVNAVVKLRDLLADSRRIIRETESGTDIDLRPTSNPVYLLALSRISAERGHSDPMEQFADGHDAFARIADTLASGHSEKIDPAAIEKALNVCRSFLELSSGVTAPTTEM